MFTHLLAQTATPPVPQEGDLYKELTVFGETFEIRYGYYEEFERQHHEPMAIYPDFIKHPVYTEEGYPFVTAMQDICNHYEGIPHGDTCCECGNFRKGPDLFGLCTCLHKKRSSAPKSR